MKNILSLLALAIILFSCDKEVKKKTEPVQEVPLNERPIPPQPGKTTADSNSIVGGAHYICPQNHSEGNSGSNGVCPKCNATLLHNQGFHSTQQTTPVSTTTPTNTQTTPTNNNSPNANGQFHYTCSNGCAGGSGGAGNCATCGNTLAHNQAYHN